jgi:hypothetical protein
MLEILPGSDAMTVDPSARSLNPATLAASQAQRHDPMAPDHLMSNLGFQCLR